MINYKIKPLTKEQLIISFDRLTRFKYTETKYLRVFKDVIIQNLLYPKFSKYDLEKMSYEDIKNYAQNVINYSIEQIYKTTEDYTINQKLFEYESSIYKISKDTEALLKNKIKYSSCLELINKNSPKNLLWMKTLNDNSKNIREKKSLLFPIEKVILAEGITEETLLPVFSKLYNYDFDKNGVFIISAGGKNQIVKLYYELIEYLKLPIFVLFDNDGKQNAKEIEHKLRLIDKIHIIKCGEFEDMLPLNLIKKTLEYELQNISIIEEYSASKYNSMVEFLETMFKNRGMHEFKKSEFAQMIKNNAKTEKDVSAEIANIIEEIKTL